MTKKPAADKSKTSRPKAVSRKKIPPLNLIGVFVLAAGLAAFVAVLYLGYVKFFYDVEYRDGLQAEQSVE